MALLKTYMKLAPTLLLRNNIKLCIRAKHVETRTYQYLWRANPKIPSTPEEIKEAAEKYNLHVSEYKPYGPDYSYGDYPKLPYIGAEARGGYYPWDSPAFRRNFCEAVHMEVDQMGEDRIAAGVKHIIPLRDAYIMLIGTFIIYGIFFYIGDLFPWFQPVMEKQYPTPGTTHYTFETLH